MSKIREGIKDKQRIVIKIGSSSLQHKETGDLDYIKLDVLCRELCNLRNQGKDVILMMDSFGIGGAEDAQRFGDEGANTLGHIAQARGQ